MSYDKHLDEIVIPDYFADNHESEAQEDSDGESFDIESDSDDDSVERHAGEGYPSLDVIIYSAMSQWQRRLAHISSEIIVDDINTYRRMHNVVDSISNEMMQLLQLCAEYVDDTSTEDAVATTTTLADTLSRRRSAMVDPPSSARSGAVDPSPSTHHGADVGGPTFSLFHAPSYNMNHDMTGPSNLYRLRANL